MTLQIAHKNKELNDRRSLLRNKTTIIFFSLTHHNILLMPFNSITQQDVFYRKKGLLNKFTVRNAHKLTDSTKLSLQQSLTVRYILKNKLSLHMKSIIKQVTWFRFKQLQHLHASRNNENPQFSITMQHFPKTHHFSTFIHEIHFL